MLSSSLFGPAQSTGAVRVVLDVLERSEHGPQLAKEASLIGVVEVAEKGLDGLSRLVSLVEGNTAGTSQ